jgi:hypothetical protein
VVINGRHLILIKGQDFGGGDEHCERNIKTYERAIEYMKAEGRNDVAYQWYDNDRIYTKPPSKK